jgi:hypothetical protein
MSSESIEKRFSSIGEDSKPASTCSTPSAASTLPNRKNSQQESEQQEQSPPTETDWKSLSQIVVSFFLIFNTW